MFVKIPGKYASVGGQNDIMHSPNLRSQKKLSKLYTNCTMLKTTELSDKRELNSHALHYIIIHNTTKSGGEIEGSSNKYSTVIVGHCIRKYRRLSI